MKDFFISISNYCKALIAIIVGLLFPLSLLLIAYPKVLAEIIAFVFILVSIFICFFIWENKIKLDTLELLSAFALIVYTQVIHFTLLAHESNIHLSFVNLSQSRLFTGVEQIPAFSIFIICIYLMLLIPGIACKRISNANKEFSQASLNTMFIDIDNRLKKGQLSEEQAEQERNGIKSEYFSERDDVFNTVFKCMIAFIVLTVIHLVTGIGSDMYMQKLVFIEAFTANIPLIIGAAYPFIFLFVLFVNTCVRSKSE